MPTVTSRRYRDARALARPCCLVDNKFQYKIHWGRHSVSRIVNVRVGIPVRNVYPLFDQESWRQARSELDAFLKEQPENIQLIVDLALTDMGLGDKAAASAMSERAAATISVEKDALLGPVPIEILARVAGRVGEPDRAITALQKLLSIPYNGVLAAAPAPELLPGPCSALALLF
jgi:hypothetical protein